MLEGSSGGYTDCGRGCCIPKSPSSFVPVGRLNISANGCLPIRAQWLAGDQYRVYQRQIGSTAGH